VSDRAGEVKTKRPRGYRSVRGTWWQMRVCACVGGGYVRVTMEFRAVSGSYLAGAEL
jgi:hypothetical protein